MVFPLRTSDIVLFSESHVNPALDVSALPGTGRAAWREAGIYRERSLTSLQRTNSTYRMWMR